MQEKMKKLRTVFLSSMTFQKTISNIIPYMLDSFFHEDEIKNSNKSYITLQLCDERKEEKEQNMK